MSWLSTLMMLVNVPRKMHFLSISHSTLHLVSVVLSAIQLSVAIAHFKLGNELIGFHQWLNLFDQQLLRYKPYYFKSPKPTTAKSLNKLV